MLTKMSCVFDGLVKLDTSRGYNEYSATVAGKAHAWNHVMCFSCKPEATGVLFVASIRC